MGDGSAFGYTGDPMDHPRAKIVLARYDGLGSWDVGKLRMGATIVMADCCGHQCWVSPEGLEMRRNHPQMRFWCEECIDGQPGKKTLHAMPGALDTIRGAYGDEAVEEARERMRDMGVKEFE